MFSFVSRRNETGSSKSVFRMYCVDGMQYKGYHSNEGGVRTGSKSKYAVILQLTNNILHLRLINLFFTNGESEGKLTNF